MGKTSAAVKARYNGKAYDRVTLFLPKGRKQDIADFLKERGETSVNAFFSRLAMNELGLTEDEWKRTAKEEE